MVRRSLRRDRGLAVGGDDRASPVECGPPPTFITPATQDPPMLRALLTAVAAVELLAPRALIDRAERLALDNPEECEWRSWVVPVARLEGFAFLVLMWRSDASYATFKKLLGAIGIAALVYPRAYVDLGGTLAYTDDTVPEWKPWVYPGTRFVGLVYVLVAVRDLRRT